MVIQASLLSFEGSSASAAGYGDMYDLGTHRQVSLNLSLKKRFKNVLYLLYGTLRAAFYVFFLRQGLTR
jgi:hypothetical protein